MKRKQTTKMAGLIFYMSSSRLHLNGTSTPISRPIGGLDKNMAQLYAVFQKCTSNMIWAGGKQKDGKAIQFKQSEAGRSGYINMR